MTRIDLNSDLGESFGPWTMGDDQAVLGIVSSANVACGGHASDPETMFKTLTLAKAKGVNVGAHPGYPDREGFGRRIIPYSMGEIERFTAVQIGSLLGIAALVGTSVNYMKPHGAIANQAADDEGIAQALVNATKAVAPGLPILAISGTVLEHVARKNGMTVYSEIFADRAYTSKGRLVSRALDGAMVTDGDFAARRLVDFLKTGLMPTIDGGAIPLKADSICVHGDSAHAVDMARKVREALQAEGVTIQRFV